ncbi:MAG: phosphate-starvation-inducible E-like protein [Lentisphaerae bacterium GWF2_57_35]|nr:MAG: phosphate-starvation-inducible E-like protein [Lentisphaerae bacterium GWF2_57_35]
MMKLIRRFQRIVIYALLYMLLFVVAISTIEVAIYLVRQLMEPPVLLLDVTRLLDFFGIFMMVIIGLELLHSIRSYIVYDKMPVEEVFMVAMIALARKVIVLDVKASDSVLLLGLSALILSLSVGYYLVKKSVQPHPSAS